MKADSAVQRQLLDLAEVDAELTTVAHRRRTLPELTEIENAEKSLRGRKDALVAVQTQVSDLDREITRQEREIDSVRARADKDRSLLESGSVGAKQLTELEHELTTIARRQGVLEDDLLELMEQREALQMDVQRTAAEVDAAENEHTEAARRRDEAFADLDTTQARREAARRVLVPQFPADLLARYDRVREQKGTGAALLQARRCGACRLELDRSTIADIKAAPVNDVLTCENCGAILVRTSESGL